MKTLNVVFEDAEFQALDAARGKETWRTFLKRIAAQNQPTPPA